MRYNKRKLIDLLLNAHVTNIVIGKEVGLHTNMVGRITRGESLPSLESLSRFAEYFNKDMNYFFDGLPLGGSKEIMFTEPSPEYEKSDPWKLLFEKQEEITELKIEIERLKNVAARRTGAQAG